MSEHRFELRLRCRYQAPDNTVTELVVEHLNEGDWQVFDLCMGSPGFLVFIYSILTCQHLYLRANCAERALVLDSARGSITMITDEDWAIRSLSIEFVARLAEGSPSGQDIEAIVARMQQCPVSRNLAEIADSRTTVRLE